MKLIPRFVDKHFQKIIGKYYFQFQKIALMQKFYASPNDVDLNIGGSLEKHSSEAIFGPTFQCIMAKQFLRTRKADRFFFEHNDENTGFTPGIFILYLY